jgi:hypothetical protein
MTWVLKLSFVPAALLLSTPIACASDLRSEGRLADKVFAADSDQTDGFPDEPWSCFFKPWVCSG